MHPLQKIVSSLPEKSRVLDYGCYNWPLNKLCQDLGRDDLIQHGCDLGHYSKTPDNAEFHLINPETNEIDVKENSFDLIVLSHVIEHSTQPLALFEALLKLCKPGGQIYIEAPSDRSTMIKSDENYKTNSFLSFWDDPTHIRPWTPAAFYRMSLSYECELIKSEYITSAAAKVAYPFKWLWAKLTNNGYLLTDSVWSAKGWLCYALIKKPSNENYKPVYKYISLKD